MILIGLRRKFPRGEDFINPVYLKNA